MASSTSIRCEIDERWRSRPLMLKFAVKRCAEGHAHVGRGGQLDRLPHRKARAGRPAPAVAPAPQRHALRRDIASAARAVVPLRSALPAGLAHQFQRPRNVAANVL